MKGSGGVDFVSILSEARALDPKVFPLVRFEILASLALLGGEGAAYRDLKASLGVTDGALFSNLKALQDSGYVLKKEVEFGGKRLDAFALTPQGAEAFRTSRAWIYKLLSATEGV
ncbi:ArsR family transcriptional regulator [Candidatus Micrarchaeota archaeon CG08_land_8_20_14_0_20_59_11]|nr:MAG: ArsR family transcriptional regulator [Candidatus Micrarchaeota archaeon CG08_land_8_20_14_0_20_59_11]